MKRFDLKSILVLTLPALMTWPAMASKKTAVQVTDKVFILRGADKPAQVVNKDAKNFEHKTYMRMPDLNDGEPVAENTSHARHGIAEESHKITPALADHGAHLPKAKISKRLHAGQNHVGGHSARLPAEHAEDVASESAQHEDLSGTAGGDKSKLVFKKEVITGAVRLPRVKFARVGVPMELRDEEPSLDFTHKTLKDSGY
jgi:hypothetical protein